MNSSDRNRVRESRVLSIPPFFSMLIWEVSESLKTKAGKVTHMFAKNQAHLLQSCFHHPRSVSSAALWGQWLWYPGYVPPKTRIPYVPMWDIDQRPCRWGMRGYVLYKPSDGAWHRFRAGDDSDILMLNDVTL